MRPLLLHLRRDHDRWRIVAALGLLVVWSLACGARSGLLGGIPASTEAGAPIAHGPDGGARDAASPVEAASRGDSARDVDAGLDECPFAVLATSPLPMFANCSTRDGRSRTIGPSAPHVTWTTMLPGFASVAAGFGLAADTGGSVYAASSLADDAWLARIDAATGIVEWSSPFSSAVVAAPLLLTSGTIEVYATKDADLLLDGFNSTGAVVSVSIGSLVSGTGIPAVGADGSLYVTYAVSQAGGFDGVISRVLPDATIAWTTTLTKQITVTATGISTPALTLAGLVVAAFPSQVVALDPETGGTVWSSAMAGTPTGGPAVAPDGSIVVTADTGSTNTLSIFEPSGELRVSLDIADGDTVYAIARDGTIVVGGGELAAVSAAGAVLWAVPGVRVVTATIDARGTIVVTLRETIEGLDLASGAQRWSVSAPNAVPCISTATLTSNAGMVAFGCVDFHDPDGEVFAFGVSDD